MEITLGNQSDGGRGGGDGAAPRATVYHRTGSRERRRAESVVAALERLRRSTALDDLESRAWPDAVSMDRSSWPVDVYRSASAWAERNGVSVEPPFRVASVASSRLLANDEMLRTPEICLAVMMGGDIRAVYPHTTDAGIVDVRRGLRRMTAVLAGDAADRWTDGATPSSGGRRDGAPTP